jgi:hypothetical protein
VSVSLDGLTSTVVTVSETTYVAIDGDGTAASSGTNGFDLAGMGAIYLASVPVPAALPLKLGGLAVFGAVARKRARLTAGDRACGGVRPA